MATGRVTFRAPSISKSFTCWLGNDGAKPTGGYGGWDLVDRPRRLALTQWNGRNPFSMDLALLFDGWANDVSQEAACLVLEKMAFSSDFVAPPIIKISGDAVPHTDLDYVITNISWGDQIRRQDDGERLRAEATVSVTRFVNADKVQLSAAKRARDKALKTPKPTVPSIPSDQGIAPD